MSDISVVQNEKANRYEVRVDGRLAGFAEYVVEENDYVFVHTEVDDAYAGQGLATKLATDALDDVIANGHTIVPLCPFIAKFVLRHKDPYEAHVKWRHE
jgi:predicted GNAT family acetyltransferase